MENEKNVKKICIIAQGYPTDKQPWFPFVDQLICAFSDQNVECTVIAPQSIMKGLKNKNYRRPKYWEKCHNGHIIKIYQPRMLSFSTLKLGNASVSQVLFERAVVKCFGKIKEKFDVVYGHFWICGLIASKLGKKYNTPAFVASGESEIKKDDLLRNWC